MALRHLLGFKNIPYKYRGLACDILPEEDLWCVSGMVTDEQGYVGGGILEWCFNEGDAAFLANEMKKDAKFAQLRVHKYKED